MGSSGFSFALLPVARYSVSVFQPPFQPGRMALESQGPGCTMLHSTSSLEAGDSERDPIQPPELQLVTPVAEGDTGVPRVWATPDRGPMPSTSGVSPEMLASGPIEVSSLPAGERVSRPEGESLVKGSAAWGQQVGESSFSSAGRGSSNRRVLS